MMKYATLIYICFFCFCVANVKAQIIVLEDFETTIGDMPPMNWLNQVNEGGDINERWQFDNPANRHIPAPIEGNFAIFDSDYYGAGSEMEDALLISPVLEIEGLDEIILEFDQQFRAWEDSYGSIEILVGEDWVEAYNTGTEDIGYSNNDALNESVSTSLNLTELLGENTTTQIRFRYMGNWSYWWAIDNVKVSGGLNDWDIEVLSLEWENTPFCYESMKGLYVRLQNNSGESMKFFELLPKINVVIDGPNDANFEVVLDEGSLDPQQNDLFFLDDIDLSQSGNYTVTVNIDLDNDILESNDIGTLSINIPEVKPLPMMIGFDGYNGENLGALYNWLESSETVFENDYSTWTSGDFRNLEVNGSAAKINLFSNVKNEWLVSSLFECTNQTILKFDLAITQAFTSVTGEFGSDDFLQVVGFKDCGSMDVLATFDSNSELNEEVEKVAILLNLYAGQTVRIGFLASDGVIDDAADIDVFLDNILIENLVEKDLGFEEAQVFFEKNCFSENENLCLTLVYEGTQAFDFSMINAAVEVTIGGAASYSFSQPISAGLVELGDTLNVCMDNVDLSESGTYNLSANIVWSEDQNIDNDILALDFVNTIYDAPSILLDFQSYNGLNMNEVYDGWSEAQGFNEVVGNTSNWTVAPFGNDTTLENGASAKISLIDNVEHAWLLSPPYLIEENTALTYDLALTNLFTNEPIEILIADTFFVKISTDCGQSFSDFIAHPLDNTIPFTGIAFTHLMNAYQGQEIVLGFYMKEGEVGELQSADFFLDNIQLKNLPNLDIEINDILSPENLNCFGENEVVEIQLKNAGAQAINFEGNAATIQLNVTGDAPQIISEVINTGTLAPQESMNLTIEQTLDLSESAIYQLTAMLIWFDDQDSTNNVWSENRAFFKPDYTILDGVDFNNYTGENLAIYPRWREATGLDHPEELLPQTEWVDDFFANDVTHPNEISARINLWKNEKNAWLVGPRIYVADSTTLYYDIALCNWESNEATQLGSDDFLKVMVSTDCGASYFPIKTYDASSTISATGQNDSLDLSIYNDQEITFAFYASEGTIDDEQDVELFLDNIVITNLDVPPGDVGVAELINPEPSICEDSTTFVTVRIMNYSENKMTDIEVTTIISGAVEDTLVQVVSEVDPNGSGYIYYGDIDTWGGGELTFTMFTKMEDDTDVHNDTLVTVVNAYPFPEVQIQDSIFVCGVAALTPEITGEINAIQWNIGTTDTTLLTAASGEYVVVVSLNGCIDTDTIYAEVRPYPEASFTVTVDTTTATFDNTSTSAQTFLWDFGDGTTDDERHPDPYTYDDTTTYTISLIVTDSLCGSDTTFQTIQTTLPPDTTMNDTINDTIPMSLFTTQLPNIQLYPNPNQGIFYLDLPERVSLSAVLRLYTSQGRQVWEQSFEDSLHVPSLKVDASTLKAGIYWVELVSGDQRWIGKVGVY